MVGYSSSGSFVGLQKTPLQSPRVDMAATLCAPRALQREGARRRAGGVQRVSRRPRSAPNALLSLAILTVAAVESLGLLVSYGFLSWLIGSKLLKLSRADFEQLAPDSSPGRRLGRFAWGTVLGLALAILALVIAVPAGHAGWVW